MTTHHKDPTRFTSSPTNETNIKSIIHTHSTSAETTMSSRSSSRARKHGRRQGSQIGTIALLAFLFGVAALLGRQGMSSPTTQTPPSDAMRYTTSNEQSYASVSLSPKIHPPLRPSSSLRTAGSAKPEVFAPSTIVHDRDPHETSSQGPDATLSRLPTVLQLQLNQERRQQKTSPEKSPTKSSEQGEESRTGQNPATLRANHEILATTTASAVDERSYIHLYNESLIPAALGNIADIDTPYDSSLEVPLFWHLPKSGGTSIKHMYSDCYQLVEACENGVTEGHGTEPDLQVVELQNKWRVVNVDTTLEDGIDRAAALDLIPSRLAHLVVTPLLQSSATKLFSSTHKARLFTIFRHPIERVVSLFYYLQKADWEPTYNPTLRNMTLEQYANSSVLESNFVTRLLLDKMEAPLEEQDFNRVVEILRTKCLVGLLEDGLLETSVDRFDKYFGFRPIMPECKPGYLKQGTNRYSHPKLPRADSIAYKEMARKNHMDLRLYEYAKKLFEEQASLFPERGVAAS